MDKNHALYFDPTTDEVSVLKHIELTGPMPLSVALRTHLPGRLSEQGFLARNSDGAYEITDKGRALIQRLEG